MASEQYIDRLLALYRAERGMGPVGELASIAREAVRERDEARAELAAERERSHRLVEELRSMVERWERHGTQTGTPCCERELRAALAEYEGGQTDGE